MKKNFTSKLKHYSVHSINLIKTFLDFRFIRKSKVGIVFEEINLKRFFEEFEVDCVFDVGANYGQYATMLRDRIGYKGQIISFEPIPNAQKVLMKLSESDPNWHIEPIALDSISEKKKFNIMNSNQFSSLYEPSQEEVDLFEKDNRITEEIVVQTETLSFVFEKYKKYLNFKRPFLKMDTQGNDLQIASGSENVLQFFTGLQSELSIKKIYNDTQDFKKVIEYYNSQGFELSAFVPNNEGHFPRLIEIDCIMFNRKFLPDKSLLKL